MIRVISPSRKPHNRASLGHSIKPTELQRVPKPNKSKSINKPSLQYRESRNKTKKHGKKRRPTRRRRRHSLLGWIFFHQWQVSSSISLSLSLFLLYNLSVLLSLYLIIWCVKMCSYQLTTFTFGSQVIQLFCLHSASSEFLLYTVSVLQHNYIKLNPFHVFIWFLFFFSFFLGFFWVKYELGIGKLNNFISILYIFDIDFQWWN